MGGRTGTLQEVLREELGASLWLLEYKEDLTPLKKILLRRSFSLPPSTVILLLCSSTNTTSVFSFVRQHNLESPGVWWLVIAESDISWQLEGVLREGSQVVLAVRKSTSLYELLVAKVDTDGQPKFVVGTYWNWERNTLRPEKRADRPNHEPLTSDLLHVYRDFGGRRLVMATIENMPFVKLRGGQEGHLVTKSGIDVRIMGALGQQLNFTFQVLTPPDRQWGGPLPNGSVSGIIGQVARREAHLAICEITITGETILWWWGDKKRERN
ncbi:Glutamate receptor ionotropic, delta-1 [Portunus trituberculatus]|uniref:Glutamate receptor ionotropic, delta-1 n=1 Tax=Portunus trituberculatus TaxID=210409 RepID=A0A5B7GKI8_PORTR|nr:Glutamate receptor ionotropic, delta-1 [Portunus trituberculatus]